MRSELGEEDGSGSGDVGWMGRMRSGRGGEKEKRKERKKKDDREERLKSRMVLGKDMRTFNGGVKSSKEKDEHFSLLSTILCGNDRSLVS
ncbi:hypothetical protein V1477_015980 [Vespula maculifrons]|uniref:Uncharacterized protein n=1 Tax=Vespula maculifrons TaxID=7453 RepID=A0ABD2BBV3_VESMC